jgi:hypothetical protein
VTAFRCNAACRRQGGGGSRGEALACEKFMNTHNGKESATPLVEAQAAAMQAAYLRRQKGIIAYKERSGILRRRLFN